MESTTVWCFVLLLAFPSAQGYISFLPDVVVEEPVNVQSVVPHYGPVSGGTEVAIQGSPLLDLYTNDTADIYVTLGGKIHCNISWWNDTVIVARTPPLSNTSLAGTPLILSLEFNTVNGTSIVPFSSNFSYTYRPDPVINSVEPMEAIAKGGIRLTVEGENLDSVARTFLVVTKLSTGSPEETFTSPCEEPESPEKMICLTPEVDEPSVRKKRDTRSTDDSDNPSYIAEGTLPKPLRLKREADPKRVAYYLGFIQDGFQKYRDLRDTELPAFLNITDPPDIVRWEEVQKHKAGDSIAIEGEDMTRGCTADDYVVTVGKDLCSDLLLTSSNLVCRPPESEPEKLETVATSDGHRVYVSIGYHQTYVGLLKYRYSENKWYGNTLILAGIGAAGGILLIIIGALVLCKCCDKMRRRHGIVDKLQTNDMYLSNVPQGYERPIPHPGPYPPVTPQGYKRPVQHPGPYRDATPQGYERPVQQPGPYRDATPQGYERPVQHPGPYRDATPQGYERPVPQPGQYIVPAY